MPIRILRISLIWAMLGSVLGLAAASAEAAVAAMRNQYLEQGFPSLLLLLVHQRLPKAMFGATAMCAALLVSFATMRAMRWWMQRRSGSDPAASSTTLRQRVLSVLPGLLLVLTAFLYFRWAHGPRMSGSAALAFALLFAAYHALPSTRGPRVLAERWWARIPSLIPAAVGGISLALVLLLAAGWLHGLRPAAKGPSVIVIVLDTVRWHNLSVYKHARDTTPNLRRIFKDGLIFENAFAVAPWTLPSHASLFTGLYACQHGATQEAEVMPARPVMLAELLYRAGYQTAAFSNNPNVSTLMGFDQGFQSFEDVWSSEVQDRLLDGAAPPDGDAGAVPTQRAIEQWFAQRDRGRPYFMFVNLIEPHAPYKPPAALGREYLPPGTDLSKLNPNIVHYNYVRYLAGDYSMSEDDFARARDLYDAEIRYLDSRVGALFDAIKEAGDLDNTLFVVTSDHGEFFDHGLVGHQFGIYDTALHIPLMLRFPGVVPQGQRSTAPVMMYDLFATILEVTGIESKNKEVTSRSLLKPLDQNRDLFAEYYRPTGYLQDLAEKFPEFDASRYDRRLRSIRRGDHKLIWSSNGRHELYDVKLDPFETRNLASSEPDKLEELSKGLATWARLCGDKPLQAPKTPANRPQDAEFKERLRALGYGE